MPTYNYRCTKCEKIFDAFHSMMSTEPQHCPACGAAGNKLLSASSVIFKGSGFYSTDYRDSGYLEAKKKDGSNGSTATAAPTAPGKSEAPAAGTAESKPEATPAAAKPAAAATTGPITPATPAAQAA
ncbi:MAG TPA: zinc ribbon domain-containing protein [Candidatus Rifleibacterium sp.]|nr:zinc ribbon domain-containing protein [Candidatus Rifleibacterium sp.]HPT48407.1 zinc ribbon domain-containing protein [Candidatus Rifleibacterium sp.]